MGELTGKVFLPLLVSSSFPRVLSAGSAVGAMPQQVLSEPPETSEEKRDLPLPFVGSARLGPLSSKGAL